MITPRTELCCREPSLKCQKTFAISRLHLLESAGGVRRIVEALQKGGCRKSTTRDLCVHLRAGFFSTGFREVERGELPLKVWKDCLRCPKFQCLDEIAMLKALRPHPVLGTGTESESVIVQLTIKASRVACFASEKLIRLILENFCLVFHL
jgi:hypothetical protein